MKKSRVIICDQKTAACSSHNGITSLTSLGLRSEITRSAKSKTSRKLKPIVSNDTTAMDSHLNYREELARHIDPHLFSTNGLFSTETPPPNIITGKFYLSSIF